MDADTLMLEHPLSLPVPSRGLPAVADTLTRYLAQVDAVPLLTREEERSLALRYYEDKDIQAAHRLVVSNLRFVVKIALEYKNHRARLLDLIQEGNIGLMIAVKKFNPHKGYRLISYAVWWIRAYIQAFITKTWSLVRRTLGKARAAALGQDQDSPVTEGELRQGFTDFSLDTRIGEDSGTTHLDVLADPRPLQEEVLSEREEKNRLTRALRSALDTLTPKETYILTHHILADAPQTLEEIGKKFNISRERVRQIKERALDKLRARILPAT